MNEKSKTESENPFEERKTVYMLLMAASGMMGAYTYVLRGGVFCNAQTGNLLLMGMTFGHGNFLQALYYLIPMAAYLAGSFVSELLRTVIYKKGHDWWNLVLVSLEMAGLLFVGFIPLSIPDQFVQILITFLCSMQYNTFRQARGIPMATTFCTNHVRQIGIWLAHFVKDRNQKDMVRLGVHTGMLVSFIAGAGIMTALCLNVAEKAAWAAMLPLFLVFILLLQQESQKEKAARQAPENTAAVI